MNCKPLSFHDLSYFNTKDEKEILQKDRLKNLTFDWAKLPRTNVRDNSIIKESYYKLFKFVNLLEAKYDNRKCYSLFYYWNVWCSLIWRLRAREGKIQFKKHFSIPSNPLDLSASSEDISILRETLNRIPTRRKSHVNSHDYSLTEIIYPILSKYTYSSDSSTVSAKVQKNASITSSSYSSDESNIERIISKYTPSSSEIENEIFTEMENFDKTTEINHYLGDLEVEYSRDRINFAPTNIHKLNNEFKNINIVESDNLRRETPRTQFNKKRNSKIEIGINPVSFCSFDDNTSISSRDSDDQKKKILQEIFNENISDSYFNDNTRESERKTSFDSLCTPSENNGSDETMTGDSNKFSPFCFLPKRIAPDSKVDLSLKLPKGDYEIHQNRNDSLQDNNTRIFKTDYPFVNTPIHNVHYNIENKNTYYMRADNEVVNNEITNYYLFPNSTENHIREVAETKKISDKIDLENLKSKLFIENDTEYYPIEMTTFSPKNDLYSETRILSYEPGKQNGHST